VPRKITALDIVKGVSVYRHDRRIFEAFKDKGVWITGIGGSIGWELARVLMHYGAKIGGVDCNEERVSTIVTKYPKLFGRVIPGFFKDVSPLKSDYIFHCAAWKHVRLASFNPSGYYDNNYRGVSDFLDSLKDPTTRFVLVSTDKVSGGSMMGHSKRMAEDEVTIKGHTALRLVNVAYSHGSVLDVWRKTKRPRVCRDDVKRYWMQARDACYALCLAALSPQGLYTVHHVPEFTMEEMRKAWERVHGYVKWREFELHEEAITESLVGKNEKMVIQNNVLARVV
jgi:FlaA1/EpsC-like NDP-sugar epimerase